MNEQRHERMEASLQGLVTGDGYGQALIWNRGRAAGDPAGPWTWTDDSEMAFSIAAVLLERGELDPDALAQSFAAHFDEGRMYGPGMLFEYFPRMKTLLEEGRESPWQTVAGALFNGQGSFGNGSAMRVAPLGAFFADDLTELVEAAELSAAVTHAHAEAKAGAVAVALATRFAVLATEGEAGGEELLREVFAQLPPSAVRAGIEVAFEYGLDAEPADVASEVGNGSRVTCQDTVPFALWVAARHLGDYSAGVRVATSVLGDIDTLGAIVGGILAAGTGISGIPAEWREQTEAYPEWFSRAARTASSQP